MHKAIQWDSARAEEKKQDICQPGGTGWISQGSAISGRFNICMKEGEDTYCCRRNFRGDLSHEKGKINFQNMQIYGDIMD